MKNKFKNPLRQVYALARKMFHQLKRLLIIVKKFVARRQRIVSLGCVGFTMAMFSLLLLFKPVIVIPFLHAQEISSLEQYYGINSDPLSIALNHQHELYLNGEAVSISNNFEIGREQLVQGENIIQIRRNINLYLFEVKSPKSPEVKFIYDGVPPELINDNTDTTLLFESLDLHLKSEEGATLFMGEEEIAQFEGETLSIQIDVPEGMHTYKFSVKDEAGNTSETLLLDIISKQNSQGLQKIECSDDFSIAIIDNRVVYKQCEKNRREIFITNDYTETTGAINVGLYGDVVDWKNDISVEGIISDYKKVRYNSSPMFKINEYTNEFGIAGYMITSEGTTTFDGFEFQAFEFIFENESETYIVSMVNYDVSKFRWENSKKEFYSVVNSFNFD